MTATATSTPWFPANPSLRGAGRLPAVQRSGLQDLGFRSVAERKYWERIEALIVEARSAGGVVQIGSRGLEHWRVHIDPTRLRDMSEQAFADEVQDAFSALMNAYRSRLVLIRAEYVSEETR